MKNKLIYPMVVVVLAACGGDGERGTRAGQQYETVQEGSASGVTSTIAGPGEILPPITGTNADTTSAFALNPNAVPQPVPGTGGIPSAPPYADAAVATMTPMSGSSAPRTTAASAIQSQSQPQRQPARPAYNPPPMTSASQPVQQEAARPADTQPREAQPVEQQPATVSGPASDTTATNTAPPPAAQPEPQPEPQPEQSEDEAAEEEPPPPPPPAI